MTGAPTDKRARDQKVAKIKRLYFDGGNKTRITQADDAIASEEPLEIGVTFADGRSQSVAVTMRTPGQDVQLAAGFLYTEGIISSASDVKEIILHQCNQAEVILSEDVQVRDDAFDRHSFVASSCGVCGKRSIEAVLDVMARSITQAQSRSDYQGLPTIWDKIDECFFLDLPERLRAKQANFDSTGGIHAAAIFDPDKNIIAMAEDVGRHNALDKAIGSILLDSDLQVPLNEHVLLVSGRASFELVQKACQAGIRVIAAVGAPSSLAIDLARECKMTLIGFLRGDRYNLYVDGKD